MVEAGCYMVEAGRYVEADVEILMSDDTFLSGIQGPQMKDLILIKVTEWYELGLQLGVDDAELEEIEKNNRGDLRACRRNMFRAWAQNHSQSILPAVGRGL